MRQRGSSATAAINTGIYIALAAVVLILIVAFSWFVYNRYCRRAPEVEIFEGEGLGEVAEGVVLGRKNKMEHTEPSSFTQAPSSSNLALEEEDRRFRAELRRTRNSGDTPWAARGTTL